MFDSRERQDREIEAKLKDQRSPTDARDSEAERFKDIIEKTAQYDHYSCPHFPQMRDTISQRNFVDISSVTNVPVAPPVDPGKKKYP